MLRSRDVEGIVLMLCLLLTGELAIQCERQ
jgi:hypothetical protein